MGLCKLFGVSKQAYYQYDSDYTRYLAQERFVVEYVVNIRKDLPGLGGVKLWEKYKEKFGPAYSLGRDAFLSILFRNHLNIRTRKHSVRTTDSNHSYPKYPDLVNDLIINNTTHVWVSDITYIPLVEPHQFVFLSIVTDAYTKKIIGYCVGESLETIYTLNALDMALKQLRSHLVADVIHHSDRGIQYASTLYTDRLKQNNIRISMTQSGNPKDNAIAERVNGILKVEFLNHLSFNTIEEVRVAVDKAIWFYNHERPHRSLNMMTPCLAEKHPEKIKKLWKSWKEFYLESNNK